MTVGSQLAAKLLTMLGFIALAAGCGHSEANVATPTITLGAAAGETESATVKTTEPDVVPVSASETKTAEPSLAEAATAPASPTSEAKAEDVRTFKVEGPENSIRVSFDDVDLLKVMNLDPVPADAPERLPKWLKALDGKRIRVRGFMYPPFQDTDIRGFVLARDNRFAASVARRKNTTSLTSSCAKVSRLTTFKTARSTSWGSSASNRRSRNTRRCTNWKTRSSLRNKSPRHWACPGGSTASSLLVPLPTHE